MKMPPWFPVKGKTYIVLGLARSGLASVRWLKTQGAVVIAVDDHVDQIAKAQELGAITGNLDTIPWDTVTALIQSPGVPLWFPQPHPITREARKRNIPIMGEGDLFRLAQPQSRFIGITGTNGKSTTTALVGHILKSCGIDCQVGGNIGTPMFDLPPADTYVLELSSYQLDLSHTLDLQVAGWLNLSADHLDRHGSLENYVSAKKRIFHTSSSDQIAVIGIDDPLSEAVWREVSDLHPTLPISVTKALTHGICVQDGWLKENSEPIFNLATSSTLKGTHNAQNMAVAYGICRALKIDKTDIIKGIQTFPGLAHRQEWITTLNGISFINDSKGTNADATAKALATFDTIYWIVGGRAKSDGIDSLSSFFPKIMHTFLIGEAQDRFAETLEGKVPYTKSGTMENAVTQAYEMALKQSRPNPVILLSPACASWDQFRDFEHRGDTFRHLVNTLRD